MRFPDERRVALYRGLTVLVAAGLVAGCGALGGGSSNTGLAGANVLPANGPQADYPILVGDAYQIDGVTFTPSDTLNYDEVGYLAAEGQGMGYTGAHHTLPVPSYAEVTSLESGRTILVRLERRGPMESTHLVALAPAAMEQLGAMPGTPVRVRRTNPPEVQRAQLRAGGPAPLRMDTPSALVKVLRRKLPVAPVESAHEEAELAVEEAFQDLALGTESVPQATELDPVEAPEMIAAAQTAALPPLAPVEEPQSLPLEEVFDEAFAQAASEPVTTEPAVEVAEQAQPAPQVAHVETPDTEPADAGFVVQAAAFSTVDRAERVANSLGGAVSQSGQYFRVRTGPFLTRSQAEASLANVKAAGYEDARILTSG